MASKKSKALNLEGVEDLVSSLETYKVVPRVRGIYFLYKDAELVYIGKSEVNVYKRIEEHKAVKSFTHFKILEIPSHVNLRDIEYNLIKHFMPSLNKESWVEQLRNAKRLVDFIKEEN